MVRNEGGSTNTSSTWVLKLTKENVFG